jgi:dihydrofolate reductase
MTKVTAQLSVSLDGHYAGPRHGGDGDWLDSAEATGFFRVTRWATEAAAWRERQGFDGGAADANSEIIAESFAAAGAYVMGRRMADGGEVPWGDVPPFRAPVVVVTHRPRETLVRGGGTSFTYVTDGVAAAVARACAAAGDQDVAVPEVAAWCARCWNWDCWTSSTSTSRRCSWATGCGCSTAPSVWTRWRASSSSRPGWPTPRRSPTSGTPWPVAPPSSSTTVGAAEERRS